MTFGNGTVTSYGYDAVSRLSSLSQDLAGTTHDQTLTFGYNPAGQIASNVRSNDLYAWGQHYNVDRPYTANGLNQLITAGSVSLSYDGRGNLTSSGSSTYGYTSENRLTAGSPGGEIGYDPLGRLFYMNQPGSLFEHDGSELLIERNNAGLGVLRRYVHGPGVDEPLVWYEGSGTGDKRWLHADERGSVVAVSNASGTAIAINSYDEYGIPASTNLGRFQCTGQAWLPELGMYYYKARIYSPTLGRFMQTDPIGYADGMNFYNYVGNDPVNWSDPFGLRRYCGTVSAQSYDYATGNTVVGWLTHCVEVPDEIVDRRNGGTERAGPKNPPNKSPKLNDKPQNDTPKVDCNSDARQLADFSSRTAAGFGAATVAFAVVGAEPAAAFTGAITLGADVVTLGAGLYIGYSEGDWSVAKSSAIGFLVGQGTRTLVQGFRPGNWVKQTENAAAEAGEYGSGAGASALVSGACP